MTWDSCGCAGYCGLDWLTAEDVDRLAAAGAPSVIQRKTTHFGLSEWAGADRRHLVLASGTVRWGRRLS